MRLQDTIKTAAKSLLRSKTRTALTMLGIIIGIGSVILLMSIGQSAQDLIIGQVQGAGSNLVFVIPGSNKGSRLAPPAAAQGIIIKTLNKNDLVALKNEASIDLVAPEVRGQARIIYGNNDQAVTFEGTMPDFFPIRNFTIAKGHAFTQSDVDSFNHVIVIGSKLADKLFSRFDPIGKTVRLKNITFTVVGVLDSKGVGPFGIDQDELVLMPVSVAQKQLVGIDYYNSLVIQANANYDIAFAQSRVVSVLRQNHHITNPDKDDFTVQTQADAIDLLGSITSVLKLFLAAIASISLLVGGIGIMNIMLVSVVERTKEIGLRKAVGATDRDVITQFLVEAAILTLFGGIIGIAFGALFTTIIYFAIVNFSTIEWTFALPLSAIALATGVSVLIGLVFGIYPARQAARKSPIEALRYE
ncbi:MAG: hypothetical protein A3F25_00200 [Candidatus Yanofskybacteria bacterium RIFCSPHIGHO2_12_FULL_45_19b]|uniref:Multidrug ABC transporter substrate-binding protein n=1 Tax=Candidatus Yanofskybacteria bacterium RIFCSPHIGHO2_12_FULL_45_19b TaxID=1802689 RepID=A0A1F8G377_9BACT|nr:MAG: hypothetical protein A3F25_00200 [Candidatus Yanofskybacteria bacterium RIFCSPHIGHO2_12_FULL_45_19b]